MLSSFFLLAVLGVQAAAQPVAAPGRVCVRDPHHKPIPSLLIMTRDNKGNDGPQLTTGLDGCAAVPATLNPALGPWTVLVALQTYQDAKVAVPAPGVTRRITLKHDGDTSLQQH